MGGRGLEEIAAEPVGRPEDSGNATASCRALHAVSHMSFQACKLHRHANRLLTGWQFAASASDCFCCCSLRSVAVYYHPTLNPMGIPPPGKPQK